MLRGRAFSPSDDDDDLNFAAIGRRLGGRYSTSINVQYLAGYYYYMTDDSDLVVEILWPTSRRFTYIYYHYYIFRFYYTHTHTHTHYIIHLRVRVRARARVYCIRFFLLLNDPRPRAAATKTGVSVRIRSSLVSVAFRAARALAPTQ